MAVKVNVGLVSCWQCDTDSGVPNYGFMSYVVMWREVYLMQAKDVQHVRLVTAMANKYDGYW